MINLRVPAEEAHLQPRITVIGVGGAGGNAVNNMIRSNLEGVEFLVCNTDAQALTGSTAERRLQLGTQITRGLGAGARPDVGRAAAEENLEEIISYLDGSNMVFITAGMGGGTGTGAAPVIARAAREQNILTVGVVTKPFHFEGAHRMRLAESGIQELQDYVDTLIVIPNQNLFRIANQKTTFAEAFKMADDVLYSGVRGVTDLMVMPGLINLDFADIRTVMSEMGKAMMGTGEAEGEQRAIHAADAAISNPLLDDVSLKGARSMLINITGGMDISLFEVDEAVNRVRAEVDPDANVIFGSTFDASMEGKMRVSVVATGIEAATARQPIDTGITSIGGGARDVLRPQLVAASNTPRRMNTAGPAPTVRPAIHVPAVAPAAVALQSQPVTYTATARKLEPQPDPVMEMEEPELYADQDIEEMAPLTDVNAEHAPEGAFIAPRPMTAGPRTPIARAPARVPSSRPEAEPTGKRPTLFERMMGNKKAEAEPAPRAPAPVRAPLNTSPAQAPLGIDAPTARARTTKADEEMLDIPAFLRRQAN